METLLIALMALLFLAMGVFGLFAPASLVAPFGITLGGGDGRAEVRAVYGGFGVAAALALILAALDPAELRHGIVVAIAAALLGMAFGRLVARLFDRASGFYPNWFYFCVEAIGGGLLLFTTLA